MVKDKKAQMQQIQGMVIALVAFSIVIAIGFLILAEVKDQQFDLESKQGYTNCSKSHDTNCSAGYNGTATAINALADIPGWLPIIVITIIGAILISVVSVFRKIG